MSDEPNLLDHVLSESFLDGLDDLQPARLRELRRICEEVESPLSMQRSLLQGTMDLMRAELERRAADDPAAVPVLERLGPLLARQAPTSRGARPKLALGASVIRREVSELLAEGSLARLPDMYVHEISTLYGRFEAEEKTVSDQRRRVHQRLDAVQGALIRCYKDGRASPSDVLRGRDA